MVQDLEGGSCRLAMKWCQENRSKLQKMKSTLEYQVLFQEFLCQLQRGERDQAIGFIRSQSAYFSQNDQLQELQKACMCLLAGLPEEY